MTALLEAKQLSKSFVRRGEEPFRVVQSFDLTLAAGEVVCLLGASGSGKTTLLKILAGVETPDTGSIKSEIRRPGPHFGYLSQSDRLLPWRTILANVALGLELTGRSRSEARALSHDALVAVAMEQVAGSYPSQLSGGMLQRVLLARTLALKPQLLLMDEPMSSLDVLSRRELASLIRRFTVENKTAALVVTHSVEEACFLADRILLVTPSPTRIHKELRLVDREGDGLPRAKALDSVMAQLWSALGAAA